MLYLMIDKDRHRKNGHIIMNALPEVITFLVLQGLSADCAICKIGNDVRISNPVLSEWSLHTNSSTRCTDIKIGGVKVLSKSPEIPERRLLVQLSKFHFTSDNRYICQTLKQLRTGFLSSKSIESFSEFIHSTIKPSHEEASTFITPPSSLKFTSSMPNKHSSRTVPPTKSSSSSKDSTKSPSSTSSLSAVESSIATESPSKQSVISSISTLYSHLTIPSTSLFSSKNSTKSSFSTPSLNQDVTLDGTHTSSNLVSTTMSTPTNNPVMSSAAPCPRRFEATGEGVSCYQLIYNQLMFTYASNYCKDIQPNAHLVSFETQVEEEWVLHLIHNMTNTSGQDYWIGLKNAVYTWEDGSYLSYANFGDKYTDNGGECLYMDVSKDSIWKGGKCTDKKKILCEYEATENSSSCSIKYDNSCYFEIQTTGERAQASQTCKYLGKYVVQIETAGEQAYLNNVLSDDVWIGLLKNESATYVWDDKNNTAPEYFNFGDANNVIPLPHGGICHRMKQDDSYSWNEDRCDTEHSFICEWSLD